MTHTLLLADDSVTIQRVIELTFADEDISVVAVSDGDEAIAALDKNPPDIVLADVGMPGRDGYQVAEHIKHTPRLSHIPVLLLTGAFEPVDQARAAEAGCDGVLAKPFEPQLVIGRVKELLARPKPALDDALVPPPAAPAPWPSAIDEPSPAAEPGNAVGSQEDVDQYFDRLDRAFASLSNVPQEETAIAARAAAVSDANWFTTTASAGDAPASGEGREEPAPHDPPAAVAQSSVSGLSDAPPVPPPAMPQLADAFAALLAAERSVAAPAPVAWPSADGTSPHAQADVQLSDATIDDIVRRVLERMSDRVVRDTVADIASEAAERLVREEIERIKRGAS